MKRQNSLDASKLHIGTNFGDHAVDEKNLVEDLKNALTGNANVFMVRCQQNAPFSRETYKALAKLAKESGMSFCILYAYQFAPEGKRSHLTREIVEDIYSIAGDLFMGEVFAETGTSACAQDIGYYRDFAELVMPKQAAADMATVRREYVDHIRAMSVYDKELGIRQTLTIEPTAVVSYALEGGMDIPLLEMFPADPEFLIPFTRGAAIAYKKRLWGGLLAHEWYGGYRHNDELKRKRLELGYKYLFMNGANFIFLESGNTDINSFGYQYDSDSEICKFYRENVNKYFHLFTKNPRLSCGPYAKVAFVFGEDDGYSAFLGANVWSQFGREEWGKGDRENSWRILSEVYRSPDWHSFENCAYDGLDLGHAPAYGVYDVIPASTPVEIMKNYSHLIFVGHNTMNEELYSRLTEYVQSGGVLFMSAAHLSVDSAREMTDNYVKDGDFSELFGVKLTGFARENHGVKFKADSVIENLKYPGTLNLECDANYASGYTDIAVLSECGASVAARTADSFNAPSENSLPILTEYKNGNGVALLLSYRNYPGNNAVYPIYKMIVKALLSSSHASAKLKVTGSDKVRFSLFYEEDGAARLYLLNTSFNDSSTVTVRVGSNANTVTLSPCELRTIEFENFMQF